jgi:hypothetical protein
VLVGVLVGHSTMNDNFVTPSAARPRCVAGCTPRNTGDVLAGAAARTTGDTRSLGGDQ